MMSYLHTKFHDNWISSFKGVAMTIIWDGRTDVRTDGRSDCTPRPAFAFGDAGKKSATPRKKKWNQNFLWICASTHYVLHNYKVSRNSVERFQRCCANKKNSTDGHNCFFYVYYEFRLI